MTFQPTPEQLAVISAATDTEDNLLVNALAGAAKTSTLVLLAQALKGKQILALAFNKRIAVEMSERLPPWCKSQTLNSLGHQTWAMKLGKRLTINTSKNYECITERLAQLPPGQVKDDAMQEIGFLTKTLAFGKSCGWVPTDAFPKATALMDDVEFFSHLEDKFEPEIEEVLRDAMIHSIHRGLSGEIDFDDQIYFPTLWQAPFDRYPIVMIDEAQDLSALNHAMLRKLARKRLIAVGDPFQAIYGFRGAHEDSMNKLRNEFSMRELTLSISFRCPITVVEAAHFRAPNMRYPEWAKPGEVKTLHTYTVEDIPLNAAILCRNNAPLFSFGIKMLQHGRNIQIIGNDIGAGILKEMRKLGNDYLPREDAIREVDVWLEKKKKKVRKSGWSALEDRAACFTVFLNITNTLGEAISYASSVFNAAGPLKLMTVHKSKGLEYPDVFILDEHLIGDDAQEPNLRYVAITRSKSTLTYIQSSDLIAD